MFTSNAREFSLAAKFFKLAVAVVVLLCTLIFVSVDIYAATPQSQATVKCRDGVNVRATYKVTSKRVGGLDHKAVITVTKEKFTREKSRKKATRWFYVSEKNGWVRADNLTKVKAKSAANGTTTTAVNGRKGAGTGFKVKKVLKKGSDVKVVLKAYDKHGSLWYKVHFNGKSYYVSGAYVKLEGSTPEPAKKTTPAKPKKTTKKKTTKKKVSTVVTTPAPSSSSDPITIVQPGDPSSRVAVATSDGVNVREACSTSSKVVGTMRNKQVFLVTVEKFLKASSFAPADVWYFVPDFNGWVRSDNTSSFQAYGVSNSKTTAAVDARTGAGAAFPVFCSLEEGAAVKVVARALDSTDHIWFKVLIDSTFCYVDSDFVELNGNVQITKTSDPVEDEVNSSFLTILANLEKKMKNNHFKYSGSVSLGSFENALASKKKTNCAQYVSWAMQEYGLLPKGKCIYLCKSIKGAGASYIKKSSAVKILYPKKKTKNVTLQPGDICGYQWGKVSKNKLHTMVYAGKNSKGEKLWYTMGPAQVKSSKLGPVTKKVYENRTLYVIIRPKK